MTQVPHARWRLLSSLLAAAALLPACHSLPPAAPEPAPQALACP